MKLRTIRVRNAARKAARFRLLRAELRQQMRLYFQMGPRRAGKAAMLQAMRNTYRKINACKGLPLLQDMATAADFRPSSKQRKTTFIQTTGHADALGEPTGNRRFFACEVQP